VADLEKYIDNMRSDLTSSQQRVAELENELTRRIHRNATDSARVVELEASLLLCGNLAAGEHHVFHNDRCDAIRAVVEKAMGGEA